MNILLLASHSVAEYDDIRMFSDLGYDVFCPGGYQNPSEPGESLRPALPNAPYHPELVELCEQQRFERGWGDPRENIDWAKARLHDDLIDWADVIICHHFPEQWIGGQWDRIRHKRVIWRTCGQSDPRLEQAMTHYRYQGLQIIRYSPKEQEFFGGTFAGQDAVIRFGKYPDDYGPWIGDELVVGNITQHMQQRGEACGYSFWAGATDGLPTRPAGPGSEVLPGGIGALDYRDMLEYLRHIRVYLYTGTRPASYTLGLMEAMLSGTPVVSMTADSFYPPGLFEGEEIVRYHSLPAETVGSLDAVVRSTRSLLTDALAYDDSAAAWSLNMRRWAIELFDVKTVGAQWVGFLS